MIVRTRFAVTAFLLVIGGIASCSQNVHPPTCAPTSGVVTVNGKPMAGVRVTLEPQFRMGRVQWGVRAETDPEGKFIVSTGAPGNGAPLGDYIVTFTKPRIDNDFRGIEIEVDDFKGKYSNADESEWMVKIVDGENEIGPFDLK